MRIKYNATDRVTNETIMILDNNRNNNNEIFQDLMQLKSTVKVPLGRLFALVSYFSHK